MTSFRLKLAMVWSPDTRTLRANPGANETITTGTKHTTAEQHLQIGFARGLKTAAYIHDLALHYETTEALPPGLGAPLGAPPGRGKGLPS